MTGSHAQPDPATSPRSNRYVAHGLELHYVEWGQEDAPPVILMHGGYDHARAWDRIAATLAGRYRVIVPDARGHGDSDWSREGRYALLDHVEDLECLFRHLKVKTAVVIGHSYGGRVVIRHAGTYPERVEKLVAIEGSGPGRELRARWRETPVAQRLKDYYDRRNSLKTKPARRFESLDACAARFSKRNPQLRSTLALHLARHGTHIDVDGSYRWKFDPSAGLLQPIDITDDEERALFKSMALPALLVAACNDDRFGARL